MALTHKNQGYDLKEHLGERPAENNGLLAPKLHPLSQF